MTVENTYKQHNASEVKLTGYKLHKAWFSFALNNPNRVTPTQGILYLYCVELCNSLGWPKTFGLPAVIAMAATGIKSYNTYTKTFRELVEIGAIKLVAKSTNQYTANIIALSNFNEASTEPHDKAPTSAIIAYKNNELKIAKPLNKIEAEGSAFMYASDELNIDDYKHDLPGSDTPTPIEKEIPPNGKFSKNNLDEFEKVWQLYGKKGNKKTSLRRWEILSAKNKNLAFVHIPQYVTATPDIQYRKNFETYLNQEAWNDEIILPSDGRTGQQTERRNRPTTITSGTTKKDYGPGTL